MRNRYNIFKRAKPTVKAEEWEQIERDGNAARELLEDERFAWIRTYLDNHQNSIKTTFAKQSIEDVYIESRTYTEFNKQVVIDSLKRIFRPAKKEYSHLAGEFKFVESMLSDIVRVASLPKEIEDKAKEGIVEIERSKE